ncbi:iron-sulfur cluster assembly scaffold protein [Chitinivibrio alkaliphilus]|uniref:IscU protein n=1 Tax=Chitinivibrio alkaliphilus ACht1 TaxID=1313304 RepID=U7D789_9BACT|nr:iron-sulfur cluster assembly scaffold protein [Chitinivibrio alkaliphilus]ERP31808.1 IscU protein [Chitinivibrio alkaliphilus ACht1]
MSGWVYSEVVKDHFINPRNAWKNDEDFAYDCMGKDGNVQCGDEMLFALQIDAETEKIIDCRWQTFGCASAIASTSMLSEAIKGLTLEEAMKITPKDITERLGGLPDNKIHCSVLGDKALCAAANDYFRKNGMEDRVVEPKAKLICECKNVTDLDIEESILEGSRTYTDLQDDTGLGTVCGRCRETAESLLEHYIEKHFK